MDTTDVHAGEAPGGPIAEGQPTAPVPLWESPMAQRHQDDQGDQGDGGGR